MVWELGSRERCWLRTMEKHRAEKALAPHGVRTECGWIDMWWEVVSKGVTQEETAVSMLEARGNYTPLWWRECGCKHGKVSAAARVAVTP